MKESSDGPTSTVCVCETVCGTVCVCVSSTSSVQMCAPVCKSNVKANSEKFQLFIYRIIELLVHEDELCVRFNVTTYFFNLQETLYLNYNDV